MASKWTSALAFVACLLVSPCVADEGTECTLAHDFGLPFNVSLSPAPRLLDGKSLLAIVSWEGCATSNFALRFEEVPRKDSSYAVVWLQRTDSESCRTHGSQEDSDKVEKDINSNIHQAALNKPLEEEFAFTHSDILFAFPPDHPFESYRLKPDFSQPDGEDSGAHTA